MTDLAKRLSGSHDIAGLVSKPLSPQLDGRKLQRAVNYALARIRGVLVSAGSRRRRVVAAR